jgi:hypothetical protein
MVIRMGIIEKPEKEFQMLCLNAVNAWTQWTENNAWTQWTENNLYVRVAPPHRWENTRGPISPRPTLIRPSEKLRLEETVYGHMT